MGFVSSDDELPNWMESHKIHVPNHEPEINAIVIITIWIFFRNHQKVKFQLYYRSPSLVDFPGLFSDIILSKSRLSINTPMSIHSNLHS